MDDDFRDNPFGVHFFTGAHGRIVLHDIFLDGNTFKDSHSLEKETLMADLLAGIAFSYRRFKFSYAYVLRTKEFKLPKDLQIF